MSSIKVIKAVIGWKPNQPPHAPRCTGCAAGLQHQVAGKPGLRCATNGFYTLPHAVCERDFKAKGKA